MTARPQELPSVKGRPMRVHPAGTAALLLDAASGGQYDAHIQARIWATALVLQTQPAVVQAVPGVNNLLVTFDALTQDPATVEGLLIQAWSVAEPEALSPRTHVVSVTYGESEEAQADLAMLAAHADVTIDAVIALHQRGEYRVAAIGAMPGFPYLTGLDARLHRPRRSSPRLRVARGAVMIGGSHAGLMPCTAPTGWHVLGHADIDLFDPHRPQPCLMALGDIVRFERR